MKKLFEKQLEEAEPITEERLKEFNEKKYFNGEEINIGDKVLFGLCLTINDKLEPRMKIILLNEKHFELFDTDSNYNNGKHTGVPVLKLKYSNAKNN